MISWADGYNDPDLDELPEYGGVDPLFGSMDRTYNPIGMTGGMPYGGSIFGGGTYIIKRHGDMVLTPEGWFDINELS